VTNTKSLNTVNTQDEGRSSIDLGDCDFYGTSIVLLLEIGRDLNLVFVLLPPNPRSLAERNLLRHLTFSLPSGQRVAEATPQAAKNQLPTMPTVVTDSWWPPQNHEQAWLLRSMSVRFDLGEVTTLYIIDPNLRCERVDRVASRVCWRRRG
jgi:hypothetical protein